MLSKLLKKYYISAPDEKIYHWGIVAYDKTIVLRKRHRKKRHCNKRHRKKCHHKKRHHKKRHPYFKIVKNAIVNLKIIKIAISYSYIKLF